VNVFSTFRHQNSVVKIGSWSPPSAVGPPPMVQLAQYHWLMIWVLFMQTALRGI